MRAPAFLLVLTVAGCGGPPPASQPPLENRPMPAQPEPERITVQHILVSFAGTRTDATRSKPEAEKLAGEVLARVNKGEDFGAVMKQLSDDPGPGVYSMFNHGQAKKSGDEYERSGMVPAFGDVGFKLAVGGIAMAPFDPKSSPFGWHIIKRLK